MLRIKLMSAAALLAAGLAALTGFLPIRAADGPKKSPSAKTESSAEPIGCAALLTPERFEQLEKLMKPATGESRWEGIPWLLDLHEARKKAAAEGKPILLWSAGGCLPIGGC